MVTTQKENKEHCRICEFLRKGEEARIYNEKRAALLFRQRTEAVDLDCNIIKLNDTIVFLTLYGYKRAIVKGIGITDCGIRFFFDSMQIGPDKAFLPVSSWHLNYNMQVCRKAV